MSWLTIIVVSASTLVIGIVIGFFIGIDYTCDVIAEHEAKEIMREVDEQNGTGSTGDSDSNCIRVDYSQQMEGVGENEKVYPQTPGSN